MVVALSPIVRVLAELIEDGLLSIIAAGRESVGLPEIPSPLVTVT